jgi:ribosomal-protein-alanine N-acetyltransferase
MILKTERLSLRPLEAADADAIHLMMSDAEVMAFWDSAEIDDPATTTEIVERQLMEMERGIARYWVVETAGDDFLGVCDLSEIDKRHSRADVGFMIARPYWGGGYTFEAMHAVIGHAAQGLRLKRLQARTHLGNVRSTGWASSARACCAAMSSGTASGGTAFCTDCCSELKSGHAGDCFHGRDAGADPHQSAGGRYPPRQDLL